MKKVLVGLMGLAMVALPGCSTVNTPAGGDYTGLNCGEAAVFASVWGEEDSIENCRSFVFRLKAGLIPVSTGKEAPTK